MQLVHLLNTSFYRSLIKYIIQWTPATVATVGSLAMLGRLSRWSFYDLAHISPGLFWAGHPSSTNQVQLRKTTASTRYICAGTSL